VDDTISGSKVLEHGACIERVWGEGGSDIYPPPNWAVETPQLRDDTPLPILLFLMFFNVNLCFAHVYTLLAFLYTPYFKFL